MANNLEINNLINYEEFNNLSEEEKQFALDVLKEYSYTGASKKFDELLYYDYKEIPVDIETFLHDRRYLGNALYNSEGKFTLFPYWENVLKDIFPDPLGPPKYNTAVFTGAIGLGKSTIADIVGIYILYRMLCLKNPYTYYGLQEVDLITFAVINITKDAARSVAWSKMQSMLKSSPWFMEHGSLNKADDPEWSPPPGIELIYGSKPSHIIGRALFWCFQDEVSFRQNMDVEKQKAAAQELVSSASARMQSRFMKGEKNPTLLVLASSKRTEQSYLESFIDNKKKNESKTTLIVDEPQWVIRSDKDSSKKFYVALGNKFLDSEVLPLNVTELELTAYRNRGYTFLQVPIGYYENFIDDIDIALTDIAGISTSNAARYINGPRLAEIKKQNIQNLFTKEIIQVGDASEDTAQYWDFIDMDRLDRSLLDRPMFVHLDLSEGGDKTGIAGVWIMGIKPPQEGQPSSKDLTYRLCFHVSVKAPKGHSISFEKNRQFIYWLRDRGFSIRGVSTDTFQSFDTGQALTAKGFKYETISVDRVDQDHICKPYQTLKRAIYEKRLEMYENKFLTEELLGLERNNNGKIDHSIRGINSKDAADALCGAVFNASKHAEEFAFEYGEDLNATVDVSSYSEAEERKQITLDFEEELKKAFGSDKSADKVKDGFQDFGMGKAKPLVGDSYYYWSQGIII